MLICGHAENGTWEMCLVPRGLNQGALPATQARWRHAEKGKERSVLKRAAGEAECALVVLSHLPPATPSACGLRPISSWDSDVCRPNGPSEISEEGILAPRFPYVTLKGPKTHRRRAYWVVFPCSSLVPSHTPKLIQARMRTAFQVGSSPSGPRGHRGSMTPPLSASLLRTPPWLHPDQGLSRCPLLPRLSCGHRPVSRTFQT